MIRSITRLVILELLALAAISAGADLAAQSQPTTRADIERELAALETAFETFTGDAVSAEKTNTASAPAERKRAAEDFLRRRDRELLPRFRDLAERARGTTVEVRALRWTMELGQRGPDGRAIVLAAMQRILETELRGADVESTCGVVRMKSWLIGEKPVDDYLASVARRAPDPLVRAAARFHRACRRIELRELGEKERRELLAELESVVREVPGTPYAEESKGYIFELEHLQVGMRAPEIEAIDAAGRPFKLSGERGKVVVLHFWSMHDPSSVATLDPLAALRDALGQRPFSLIGVNGDGPAERVGPLVSEAGVTWRTLLDGSLEGPLARGWNVNLWPTIYVLDAEGVIRHRHLRGQKLADAVAVLVGEAESRPTPGK
jgi:hypothetical protein